MTKLNLVGLVVSQGKMAKTAKVRVQWKTYNKTVHKEILKRKNYLVHDEGDICREGDIVRIEAIPRISKLKTFAIAEIKVNKGQQFALYETIAKEKLELEDEAKRAEDEAKRAEFTRVTGMIQDLKVADQEVDGFQKDQSNGDRESAQQALKKIREAYGVTSWPSTEPILNLELNEMASKITELDRRRAHFATIYEKLLLPEFDEWRNEVVSKLAKRDINDLPNHTAKNIIRKYIMNTANECPVSVPNL